MRKYRYWIAFAAVAVLLCGCGDMVNQGIVEILKHPEWRSLPAAAPAVLSDRYDDDFAGLS